MNSNVLARLTFDIRFYDAGYNDGFTHGRIHGLIEGRALGREKGFEMWEELGFYEGFALMWQAIYVKQGREHECVIFSQTLHYKRKTNIQNQAARSIT
jgi:hypothetical protein